MFKIYLENIKIRLILTTAYFLSKIILWIKLVTKFKRTEDRGPIRSFLKTGPWTEDRGQFLTRTEDRGQRSN